MIKTFINKLLKKFGYKCIKTEDIDLLKNRIDKKDYSLDSGERQVSTNLNGIRMDHFLEVYSPPYTRLNH